RARSSVSPRNKGARISEPSRSITVRASRDKSWRSCVVRLRSEGVEWDAVTGHKDCPVRFDQRLATRRAQGKMLEVQVRVRWSSLSFLVLPSVALSLAVGLAVTLAAKSGGRDEAVAELYSSDAGVRRNAVDRLAELGETSDADLVIEALHDSDGDVRAHAEIAVWTLWMRSGDPEVDSLLKSGVERMQDGEMSKAVEAFTRITERKPDFAEGWNKRATAYYLMGRFDQSLQDCDEVIKRNPQHFGALSGYGMIYLRLGKLENALGYFERALEINPNLKGVEESIELIRYKLRKDGKQDI